MGLIFGSDSLFKKGISLNEVIEEVKECFNEYKFIYLDGLFLTKEVVDKLLNIEVPGIDIKKILLVWNSSKEDRNNCIINDILRSRDKSSYNTIVHSPNSYIPAKEDPRISRIAFQGVKKYDFIDKLLEDTNVSSTSSKEYILTGSTYGSCWDEDGPSELNADYDNYDLINEESFLKILNLFDLNISDLSEETLLKCKSILDRYESSEEDYYGGCRYYLYYDYNIKNMIRYILKYHFNVHSFSEEDIMDKIPERFL